MLLFGPAPLPKPAPRILQPVRHALRHGALTAVRQAAMPRRRGSVRQLRLRQLPRKSRRLPGRQGAGSVLRPTKVCIWINSSVSIGIGFEYKNSNYRIIE